MWYKLFSLERKRNKTVIGSPGMSLYCNILYPRKEEREKGGKGEREKEGGREEGRRERNQC